MQFRKPTLDTLANIAFVVVCIVFVAFSASEWCDRQQRLPKSAKGYSVGDTLPTLAGTSYAALDRTVILFVSSGCKFLHAKHGVLQATLRGERGQIPVVRCGSGA